MKNLVALSLLLSGIVSSCYVDQSSEVRRKLELGGSWQFAIDSSSTGAGNKWYAIALSDSVKLPGTMDENHKGQTNKNRSETMRLSRELIYAGKAWYRKEVLIPDSWKNANIRLVMERTKPTVVWVDTINAGSSVNILTPQIYNLGGLLTPGKHFITIMVDNGKGSVPDGITGSHAWTEHTQGNWNGIIGKFFLEKFGKSYIDDIQVFPDPDQNKADVRLKINSDAVDNTTAFISLNIGSRNVRKEKQLLSKRYKVVLKKGENEVSLSVKTGSRINPWSEFDPAFCNIKASLITDSVADMVSASFGMREFSTSGTQFTINGVKTFLRGKHDACVFPLTGHPPMDVSDWKRVFQTAKMYGINFYRFHSWTPPQAAFEAADEEGIYLQPELSYWGSMNRQKDPQLYDYLLKQGKEILKTYGNHPSFVMFALGNELSGEQETMDEMLGSLKSADNRHLFAYGSNNFLGFRGQAKGEDYYAGCRIGADTDTSFSTHIRASFSFADAYEGGFLNGRYPSTDVNYSGAIARCTVPSVGTEVGQYQIYPNYDEIRKYTGVMKPWNLEIFRKRLEENNLSGQALSFFRASGALSVICYKADIEMAMRTPHFGGFHLLDLQDFPGQGTALVGILDAFMDSKGLVKPEEFRQFCDRVVPLAVIKKYCWTNDEQFSAGIQVANYSNDDIRSQAVKWELRTASGKLLASGEEKTSLPQGEVSSVTTINASLSGVVKAEKLSLDISLLPGRYRNSYPLWVYPSGTNPDIPGTVIVASRLDGPVMTKLAEGAKILLFPEHNKIMDISVGGLFTPDYWNYSMFRSISESIHKPVSPGTMSILTDPLLPLFNDFPTEFHTNWQWWSILKNSRPLILDNAPKDYFPLVQVVDNVDRNHKLGLIFEMSVGNGKLLVCMSDLRAIQDKPEGRQLFSSILKYMSSDKFNPVPKLTEKELVSLFRTKVSAGKIAGVKNISYN